VKVQYFGNVNDYWKLTLLRHLSEVGKFKIGVCWMLTEPDESEQGGNRDYLEQPHKWRGYDPALFDALEKAPSSPHLSDLQRIETEGIVPGATFFNEFVPNSPTERDSMHTRCMVAFADRELVFLDPDVGLEVKSAKGRRRSKYVLLDEVADHYAAGRSVLVYQHLGHNLPRKAFAEEKARKLRSVLSAASLSSSTRPASCSCWRPARSCRRDRVGAGGLTAEIVLACSTIRSCLRTTSRTLVIIDANEALPKVIARRTTLCDLRIGGTMNR
jgi:hypothetical protein